MSSGVGVSRVSIPSNARKTIQDIREITGKQHSDDEIYAVLKECSMDPNETAQKLLYLGIILLDIILLRRKSLVLGFLCILGVLGLSCFLFVVEILLSCFSYLYDPRDILGFGGCRKCLCFLAGKTKEIKMKWKNSQQRAKLEPFRVFTKNLTALCW